MLVLTTFPCEIAACRCNVGPLLPFVRHFDRAAALIGAQNQSTFVNKRIETTHKEQKLLSFYRLIYDNGEKARIALLSALAVHVSFNPSSLKVLFIL